ncbi:MAG: bifunctional DNA-formamidopyrimidine glycosylase/DNA-(apurinic or apyrimidinic site) lyase [Patescibacteria group bacterium]|nr:bifunctional DNA-formamidopyrimidine glycosylase/DNA-(apurinic or apyrimidinic site) lyase [Patescibacteria group bacterium]
MPELPEVETIKRQLDKAIKGQEILKITTLRKKSLQGESPDQIGAGLKVVGRKIKRVGRRAKVLVISLTGGQYLLIHLKMTGQLVYMPAKTVFAGGEKRVVGGHPSSDWVGKLPSKHTRVVIELSKGTLFFNDMRVFGWVKIVGEKDKGLEMAKFGPDVNSSQFTIKYLKKVLESSRRAVKAVILDQKKIGGIGNIYANDGLYLAKVNPKKPSNRVTEGEAKRLGKALKKVINKSIELGGASEKIFVHVNGMGGNYQRHFLIYKKDGKKCKRCKSIIKKEKIGGRGSYYCPKCQK